MNVTLTLTSLSLLANSSDLFSATYTPTAGAPCDKLTVAILQVIIQAIALVFGLVMAIISVCADKFTATSTKSGPAYHYQRVKDILGAAFAIFAGGGVFTTVCGQGAAPSPFFEPPNTLSPPELQGCLGTSMVFNGLAVIGAIFLFSWILGPEDPDNHPNRRNEQPADRSGQRGGDVR